MLRTARAIWREQEFLQIAHDVLARAAELHVLLAFGDILPDGLLFIERRAQLVEPGDFEIAADAHVAAVRLQLAEQQAQQRGLAGAVRADDADLVAAQYRRREVADDGLAADGVAEVLRLGDQLAGARSEEHTSELQSLMRISYAVF